VRMSKTRRKRVFMVFFLRCRFEVQGTSYHLSTSISTSRSRMRHDRSDPYGRDVKCSLLECGLFIQYI
jgi:hypothetical protein